MKLSDSPKLRICLLILIPIFAIGVMTLFILLGCDVFTLPYLTPLAHFMGRIISPFVPLVAPLTFGMFIKVYRSKEIKQLVTRKSFLFLWGSQCLAHFQRVLQDTMNLYTWPGVRRGVAGGWCPIGKCTSGYVQAGLIVGIVLAELIGLKWDGGYLDQYVHNLAEWERKKKEMEGIEEGVIEVEKFTDEKKVVEEKEAIAG